MSVLLKSVFALAALAAVASADCGECLSKCYRCDPNVHPYQCRPILKSGCILDRAGPSYGGPKLYGHSWREDEVDGVTYHGTAFTAMCSMPITCDQCDGYAGPTLACRAKYGNQLDTGEYIIGQCEATGALESTLFDDPLCGTDHASIERYAYNTYVVPHL
eukprot:comp22631_c2_seq1/m.34809 comp22631_c2_seq1/g.34809  ORF comp22631_c2_seq1/g.34809 comp22631_c2_seq1/m.34809 type:complete len:161 (-) comp22631_c2_seq1:182-664(-)